MSHPVPLPEGANLGKSFEYGIDINLNYPKEPNNPNWQPIRRISDFQPTITPITQDGGSYDSFGAPDAEKTSESFALSHSVLWNRLPDGTLLPELKKLDAAEGPEAVGNDAVVHIRYYHKPKNGLPDPNDAFEGYATVALSRVNTDASGGVEKRTVTYTGKGTRARIQNPFTGWDDVAPMVAGATPEAATAGQLVTITGTGFTGTTEVSFGTVPATVFTVVSPTQIVATMPEGEAGDASIIVATGSSASVPFTYTRG